YITLIFLIFTLHFYIFFFFFFNHPATTDIYTLSLHDALPILMKCLYELVQRHLEQTGEFRDAGWSLSVETGLEIIFDAIELDLRSEEHTSELQSRGHLVCRLLLEKKKKKKY